MLSRLRELRDAKDISQQKLALDLNVTQAAISKYELGLSEPDIAMLKNFAAYFHVSVDYLIGLSDIPVYLDKIDMPLDEINLLSQYRRLNALQKEKTYAYMQGLLQE